MKGYDYSRDNLYFVTICVDGMKCCFGDVVDMDSFQNSKLDSDAVGTSRDLSVPRDLSVRYAERSAEKNNLQKFMQLNPYGKIVDSQLNWLQDQYEYVVIHAKIVMPNHVHAVLEINCNLISGQSIKIKSLSGLIGAFKTTSSKLIHRADLIEFKWKRSFHDHIIKDDKAYRNIINYIYQNPDKWDDVTFNKK